MALLSVAYNLREEIARMNDVADFVDLFDATAWTNWTPSFVAIGGMTVTLDTNHACRFSKVGALVFFDIDLSVTTGGVVSSWIELNNVPISAGLSANIRPLSGTYIQPASATDQKLASCFCASQNIQIRRPEGGNFALDTTRLRVSGVRRI